MLIRAVRKTDKINSSINVTPMVDVMLVLLIIFMVVTPMLVHGTRVRMAEATNPEAMAEVNRADSLVVALMHDGSAFLGDEMIRNGELTDRLKDRLAERERKIIFIRADARVKYKFLAHLVAELRSAGVDRVGLLTEQTHLRERSGAPSD